MGWVYMTRLFFVSMIAASVLPLAACFDGSGSSGNGTAAGNPEAPELCQHNDRRECLYQ